MITLTIKDCNSFSQDFYDSVICSLQFHQLTCSCGHSGCLTIHAYYKRKVRTPDGHVHTLRVLAAAIYRQLQDKGSIKKGELSEATILRFINRMSLREQLTNNQDLRRYERPHINEVWCGDS